MEQFRDRQPGKLTCIALLSIAVLLLTAMAQAAHVCPHIIASGPTEADLPAVDGSLCLICLMAHPATAAPLLLMIFLSLLRSRPAALLEQQPRPLPETCSLCVRPPPA